MLAARLSQAGSQLATTGAKNLCGRHGCVHPFGFMPSNGLSLGSSSLAWEPNMGGVEVAVLVCIVGRFGLGLVALIRAERKDIPAVVRELARWWQRWSWHRQS